MNELVSYTAEGLENFQVRVEVDTVWLTQVQIAELFATKRPAITKHLNNIFNSGELDEQSTCSILEHMGNDGKQRYQTKYYNLDAILSVGYRVNSKQATKFRQWATAILKEYLLNGAVIHQPASKAELAEVEKRLKKQLDDIRQELENSEIVADAQFSEIYQALIELTSQKKLAEEKPRRRIGFKTDNE
ncbi:MAG: virulence RhuM family protein [Prevotellaceae bacterium]|jgi:hypothetical protein|nr:virulence RhuM family protein [Prevotellaceae bacterium]